MNKLLVPILVFIVAILLAGLGFFIFQNQKLIKSLSGASPSPITSSLPQTSPQITPPSSPSPQLTLAAAQNAIKTNISSQTYQNLTSYMTNPVHVILEATECCGEITPQEAADNMDYINDGIPFDFNQNSEIIKTLKEKNPQLANLFIGVSQNKEHMIAFGINAQNKIDYILMAVTWKLYSY